MSEQDDASDGEHDEDAEHSSEAQAASETINDPLTRTDVEAPTVGWAEDAGDG
jgi:hypothetical protein